MSLVETSLLVYTADNMLFHFLVLTTEDTVKLHLCGSISFEGIVALPSIVRGMSWMLPPAQKRKDFISTISNAGLYSSASNMNRRSG